MYQLSLLILLTPAVLSFEEFQPMPQIQQDVPNEIQEPQVQNYEMAADQPVAYETQNPQPNVIDRLYELSKPAETLAIAPDRLNMVMNRVGRELHFLTEKSRECLLDKVKSLNQLKRMRDGLKNAYRDIYNLQSTLGAYQTQLKEMQNYLDTNRHRVVVVDNKQLGDMYGMVRQLQCAAETMISAALRSQKQNPMIQS